MVGVFCSKTPIHYNLTNSLILKRTLENLTNQRFEIFGAKHQLIGSKEKSTLKTKKPLQKGEVLNVGPLGIEPSTY